MKLNLQARVDPSFRMPDDLMLHLNPDFAPPRPTVSLPETLPQHGLGERAALDLLLPVAFGHATDFGGDTFFAHMDPPTPWITWVASFWNAALNQNLLHPATAPAAREIEQRVVHWLAPVFGMDGGHMVPGSTVANLTALWAARGLRPIDEVVASADAHVSVRKAAHLLGLRYREVRVDQLGRIDAAELGRLSTSALVLTAGTTVAGTVDPLDVGRDAAWRHIDAAWAGPLRLCHRHAGLLDGIESADSIAVSAHKWLFQPKESALVLFKDDAAAGRVLSYGGAYLAAPNIGLLGSHGAAAVPLYATLLAWGREGLALRIDRCMEAATRLAALVDTSDEFVLRQAPVTGIVLWRPGHLPAAHVAATLQGASLSTVMLDGVGWFRSVAANPMVDVPRFFAIVQEHTRALAAGK